MSETSHKGGREISMSYTLLLTDNRTSKLLFSWYPLPAGAWVPKFKNMPYFPKLGDFKILGSYRKSLFSEEKEKRGNFHDA